MQISDIINVKNICLTLQVEDKEATLRDMVHMLFLSNSIKNEEQFLKDVMEREELGFTGAGKEIAIPHGISEEVENITIAIARLEESIDWTTTDDIPFEYRKVRLILLFAVPKKDQSLLKRQHIEALKIISRSLIDESAVNELMKVLEPTQVINIFQRKMLD